MWRRNACCWTRSPECPVARHFASWRTIVFGRWPVRGVPPQFTGPDDYRSRTNALVRAGLIRLITTETAGAETAGG